MDEQDYLRATNLAKLRICKAVLLDVLALSVDEAERMNIAGRAITAWIDELENSGEDKT